MKVSLIISVLLIFSFSIFAAEGIDYDLYMKCNEPQTECGEAARQDFINCRVSLAEQIGGCAFEEVEVYRGPATKEETNVLPQICNQQIEEFRERDEKECIESWTEKGDKCVADFNECMGNKIDDPPTIEPPKPDIKPPEPTERNESSKPPNKDCPTATELDKDWKKFSDMDETIPFQTRSIETQKYYNSLSQVADARMEMVILGRDMEIDRVLRVDLREYRRALIQNLKANLLKAFVRMAYITTDVAIGTPGLGGGARSTAKTFSKLFRDDVSKIEKIGATLKTLKDMTPSQSRFAINTENITGKIKGTTLTAALETLDSMGNGKEIGKAVAQDITKQILPSAELTDQEIEILRQQHLKSKLLDDVIQESYRINSERRDRLKQLDEKVNQLYKQADEWEEKEKQRTISKIKKECET